MPFIHNRYRDGRMFEVGAGLLHHSQCGSFALSVQVADFPPGVDSGPTY
jgi:hypothetical protein